MTWIRTEKPFPLPAYVKEALGKLYDAGYVAYIVGGSVRDFLLGRDIKDYDIATNALPDALIRIFPQAIPVGQAFGVIKIPIENQDVLEIATFRKEEGYRDHRHPSKVEFTGPEEDAARRDFTINALFFDPKTSRILDLVSGMEDLKNKVIRAIGEPRDRFKEDALRLFRAVRFSSLLGFQLDPKTEKAILSCSQLVDKLSSERIRDEMTRMLCGPRPEQALRFLSYSGILKRILPEVEALRGIPQSPIHAKEGDVLEHTFRVLEVLGKQPSKRSSELGWMTLLHDVGKAPAAQKNKGKNFNGYETEGAELVKKIGIRMKLTRDQVDAISAMVQDQIRFRDVFQMREATLQRWLRQSHFKDLLEYHRADSITSDGNLAYYEFCHTRLKEIEKQSEIPKLIDGDDLIQLGFQPGPQFSKIMKLVEDLTLENKLQSKKEALEFVVKHFVE